MSRYRNTKITKIQKKITDSAGNSSYRRESNLNISRYNTTIYNSVPESNDDIFIITQHGDRLDNLALQFYGDPNLWWFIAHVNNLNKLNLEADLSLRIPVSAELATGS